VQLQEKNTPGHRTYTFLCELFFDAITAAEVKKIISGYQ
jgi:hypothetical protein